MLPKKPETHFRNKKAEEEEEDEKAHTHATFARQSLHAPEIRRHSRQLLLEVSDTESLKTTHKSSKDLLGTNKKSIK